MQFQGNEIFTVQRLATDKLRNFFGSISERDATVIGVAMDAAVVFGALNDRFGKESVSGDALMALLTDKIERLRHM